MSASLDYDFIIIGSGAGGGTIARRLAPTGQRVLIIERGGFLPREKENWDERSVFADKRYLSRETWYDKHDQPFEPYTHYWVGGNTKVYGAALLRMREHDFGAVEHFGGTSPAWPIGYETFRPYYEIAERWYSVHGDRGSDPLEPRADGPFPHASLPPEPRIAELFADLRALGARPFPIPLGVRLDHATRGTAPYRFGCFDGYPDLTETKSDAHVCGVRPAMLSPRVELMTGAYVERLNTDRAGGTVSEVVVRRGGERITLRAGVVILAAGAINSAALMLRSTSDMHPRGLANSSDQVGRNYMSHQNGCLICVSDAPNPSAFQKHFGLMDYYAGDSDSSPYPLGLIQLMGKPDRGTLEWLRGDQLPGVQMDDIVGRTIDFFLTAEDLPSADNRITLRHDGSIKVSYTPNNTEAYSKLEAKAIELLTAAERRRGHGTPTFFAKRLGVSGVSHQNGTMRFGVDPRTSVLDLSCKAHELDNLYVVDASFFPSSSAVNPSLTIMANAIRVADVICQRYQLAKPRHEFGTAPWVEVMT